MEIDLQPQPLFSLSSADVESGIGIVGDLHFKESLGYADYVTDRRIGEREAVFDTIVESLKDCKAVVFMGDQLDSRTNHAETLRRFVAFLERFGDKELYLLAGNHEKWANGRSSLDFLNEIKGKKWHVISKGPEVHTILGQRCVFLPYMTGPELKKSQDQEWEEVSKTLLDSLPAGDFLFAHHAVEDTIPWVMEEVVLPSKPLLEKFGKVVVGHIHEHKFFEQARILLTGSIFTDIVGEEKKYVFKTKDSYDSSGLYTSFPLPVRPILKLENPLNETLALVPANAIVKASISDSAFDEEALKKHLKRFDGAVIVKQIKSERSKTVESSLDLREMTIEQLLGLYGKAKKIDESLLISGFELIK